jgi:hypothetical protein
MRLQRAGGGGSPVEMQCDKWSVEGEAKRIYLGKMGFILSIRDVVPALTAENVLAFS